MVIVKQRSNNDCSVCCLAMATGESYETVLNNLQDKARENLKKGVGLLFTEDMFLLEKLGFDFEGFWAPYNLNKNGAIIMVPSLNFDDKKHVVFWDGKNILDPSNSKKYDVEMVVDKLEYALEIMWQYY